MKEEEVEYLIKYYLNLLPLKIKATIKHPYLNEEDREKQKIKLANLIIEDYEDKVFWNTCPNCSKLGRTPKAKQCRFCKHDWH